MKQDFTFPRFSNFFFSSLLIYSRNVAIGSQRWRHEVIAISLSLDSGVSFLSETHRLASVLLTNKTLRRREEFAPPKL